MINKTNFVVRVSGIRENSYYIDYLGAYKTSEIAELVGMRAKVLEEKYILNQGVHEKNLDVYYFNNIENAQNAISEILKDMKVEKKGRMVVLTEAEIEYIRQALINEGSNTLHLSNKIKDGIFKKLNS